MLCNKLESATTDTKAGSSKNDGTFCYMAHTSVSQHLLYISVNDFVLSFQVEHGEGKSLHHEDLSHSADALSAPPHPS